MYNPIRVYGCCHFLYLTHKDLIMIYSAPNGEMDRHIKMRFHNFVTNTKDWTETFFINDSNIVTTI